MRHKGMNIFYTIVAAGQQRLRPIISTTLSTIGGIITLTITDKLWEGLGVVIIFGIAFATVLTLVVVPVMYSLFEGFGYYMTSALRGPRWEEPPTGRSFFFSRRRYARIYCFLIFIVQAAALGAGFYFLAPKLMAITESAVFQAPTTPSSSLKSSFLPWVSLCAD
ncbi:efflux RND transporter permease subunit [Thermodesulfobacteriota bacterium]